MKQNPKIKIEKIVSDGRGIGRHEGKVFFVKDVIPDEVVEVKILKEKKSFTEGEIISIIKKSPYRITPPCKYFKECGGCYFQHIDYRYHKIIKTEILRELLRMNSKISYQEGIEFVESIPYNYRNKVTLRVNESGLSYLKEKSNQFVNIDSCMIVNEKINGVIEKLNRMNLYQNFIKKVNIRISKSGKILLTFYTEISEITNLTLDLESLDVDNIILFLKDEKPLYVKGKGELVNLIDENIFHFSHSNFLQVNDNIAEKLYSYLQSVIKNGETLLDLYSGIGIYSIIFNRIFKNIYSVEGNQSSVHFQRKNIKENRIKNVSVINRFIDSTFKIGNDKLFDTVILDPPREGVDKIFLKSLLPKIKDQLIYISCDPSTLTRDINLIKDEFFISEIKIFDMFPQTKHFETVVIFERI
ncbi:MAG: 23S rRNA (uracil(1939)-C(5))-methyltransferase RlmD [bacterium]|nr:23S rRNA (uracil(1939)-C(5))-methyltransferase RlmD [bacterium]